MSERARMMSLVQRTGKVHFFKSGGYWWSMNRWGYVCAVRAVSKP